MENSSTLRIWWDKGTIWIKNQYGTVPLSAIDSLELMERLQMQRNQLIEQNNRDVKQIREYNGRRF